MQPDNFAQPSPNAVAPHSAAERFFNAPAKTAAFQTIGAEENGKFAAGAAATIAIDRVVFGAAQKAAIARKPAHHSVRPLDACEAVTSLSSACCKNFYTALRLHPGAKAVLFVPAALMWLIRSLRQRNFSSSE